MKTLKDFALVAAIAIVAIGAAPYAMAQDAAAVDASAEHKLGQHPAILVQRMQPAIDTNHFIVAHPAGLMVVNTPSQTYDHPAIVVARMARQASQLDYYMAQPPVASNWLRHDTAVAARTTQHGS